MTEQEKEFLTAIQAGDADVAKVMLAYNPNLIDTPTEIGVSVILLSAYYGYMDLATHLSSQKSDLDIFEAAATNRIQRIQLLLSKSPEAIHHFATDGYTPLGLATFFGHTELVQLLIANGADPNQAADNQMQVAPLHSAAARKRTGIAKILIEAGAKVNALQSSGVSALHSAAQNGNQELVTLLLTNGADKNLQTQEGKTALDFAEDNKHLAIIQLLAD